ncbi:hypothetical protein [Devosia rhizoryzae]|uniref:Uncharacterized protein n=1 Tax=Devosia rhizoryzae TaxID=2774137 RepID=A0ABX7C9W2_9HYPH|nr:hypothetical protein [Devosia rhizoryzae]QQR41018.1 hypothetical protein JI748_08610 [Devosia rhizoryzae]
MSTSVAERAGMQFKVKWARYHPARTRLEFCASGTRNGALFTVVTDVRCLKDPVTSENIHLVALLRLEELFRRPSASGK